MMAMIWVLGSWGGSIRQLVMAKQISMWLCCARQTQRGAGHLQHVGDQLAHKEVRVSRDQ